MTFITVLPLLDLRPFRPFPWHLNSMQPLILRPRVAIDSS